MANYQTIICRLALLLLLLAGLSAPSVEAMVLTEDTLWQGEVRMEEDVLVPVGITLTVAAGTRVLVAPAETTKIDPEYLSNRTELLIRGRLLVISAPGARASFTSTEDNQEASVWAGVIVDGGTADLHALDLCNAEAAITVVAGQVSLDDCRLTANRYGIVAQSERAEVTGAATSIAKNDYGVMAFDGAVVKLTANSLVRDNAKADNFSGRRAPVILAPEAAPVTTEKRRPITTVYRDEALPGTTVWKGRILIDGQLRCPPASRLIILPGTLIEFTKKDTNGDGIGENGLQIQGQLIAKGTSAEPIIFRSAEKQPRRGDWDSINILGSDLAQNLLEYCRIEDAYRGLHLHYSNVAANHLILHNNYRGAQFQESLVRINASRFFANKSGIQARDSELSFTNNEVFGNLNGANFYRLDLSASGNTFGDNFWDGLRVREGTSQVSGNLLAGNRMGLLISDADTGAFHGNVVSGNLEGGLQIRDTGGVLVTGNGLTNNGITGLSLRNSGALISNNLIAANGERGVGIVSFSGTFTANNLAANGKYAVGLEGPGDLEAAGNWWGGSDLAQEIYDRHDEPGLGEVKVTAPLSKPQPFVWPLTNLTSDTLWAGEIRATELLTVAPGAALTVLPGTICRFDRAAAGLLVNGRLLAQGRPEARIVFTSLAEAGASDWAGVSLERAVGSRVENCDFRFAEWGLHIHFVPMTISGCRFLNNDGGIRFRSGPMRLSRSLFSGNRVGVRSYFGNMEIIENDFIGNEIALFVREGGAGVAIHRNNLQGNERSNLRLGDFDKEDVDARENWWGEGAPLATIFDGRTESYIGKVIYEPFLTGPLDLKLDAAWPSQDRVAP
ncbi:MAG: right-handed parallel beta-helix repeat-containing protein [Desulfobulbaceae bacterium]|nr:right-handed parallel beta-helix repeat-containing protein [Desulfobulbaceae bacterium]